MVDIPVANASSWLTGLAYTQQAPRASSWISINFLINQFIYFDTYSFARTSFAKALRKEQSRLSRACPEEKTLLSDDLFEMSPQIYYKKMN